MTAAENAASSSQLAPSARRLGVLGEGRCSVVVSLSPLTAWRELLRNDQHSSVDMFDGKASIALRIQKQASACAPEATVQRVLAPYLGLSQWVVVTADLVRALREAWNDMPAEERQKLRNSSRSDDSFIDTHVRPSERILLLEDFTSLIDPEFSDHSSTLLSTTTFEIKPKSAWCAPRIIGARYTTTSGDHSETDVRLLHPRKLCQCRFSQMMIWKDVSKKKVENSPRLLLQGETHRIDMPQLRYCPNDLLVNKSADAKLQALTALAQHPENNLKLVHQVGSCIGSPCEDGPKWPASDFSVVAAALADDALDVCDRFVSLQLHGRFDENVSLMSNPVLDVELLHHWQSCVRDGGSQFQLLTRQCADPDFCCDCHRGIDAMCTKADEGASWTTPQMSLQEAVDAFYVSTTAKDMSLMITIERWATSDSVASSSSVSDCTCTEGIVSSTCPPTFVRATSAGVVKCRVGVVDIDTKTHKSIEHYFTQDADICAVVDAWAQQSCQQIA